jgi:hypothetical protein
VASSFMAASRSTSTSLDSPKQQEDVALSSVSYMYVASVLFQMF